MNLNTVFKYTVFKYCPALAVTRHQNYCRAVKRHQNYCRGCNAPSKLL